MIQLAKSMFHSITLSTSNCQFGRQRIKAFCHYRSEQIRVIMTDMRPVPVKCVHKTHVTYITAFLRASCTRSAFNSQGAYYKNLILYFIWLHVLSVDILLNQLYTFYLQSEGQKTKDFNSINSMSWKSGYGFYPVYRFKKSISLKF